MRDINAPVVAAVFEGGPWRRALELGVFVIRDGEAVFDGLDVRERIGESAAEIPAALFEIDRHGRLRGRTVVRVEAREGEAEEAAVPNIGRAAGEALVPHVAVRQHAVRFRLPLLERHGKTALLRTRKAGDLQIVRRALVAFEVPGEAADAALQREGAPALRVHRAVVCRDAAAHRDGDALLRDASVNGVHHAADGIGAVEQRRWAAHDLDARDGHGIEADRVIHACRRGVNGVAAILQDADAVAVLPADDGPACRRAVVGGAHAGRARERLAERGLECEEQAVALEDEDGLRLLEERSRQRCADDGFVEGHGGRVGWFFRQREAVRDHACNGDAEDIFHDEMR